MVIADGQHLPPAALRAFVKCKGVGNVIATSDVSPVGGLPDGLYPCFDSQVRVDGGGPCQNSGLLSTRVEASLLRDARRES